MLEKNKILGRSLGKGKRKNTKNAYTRIPQSCEKYMMEIMN